MFNSLRDPLPSLVASDGHQNASSNRHALGGEVRRDCDPCARSQDQHVSVYFPQDTGEDGGRTHAVLAPGHEVSLVYSVTLDQLSGVRPGVRIQPLSFMQVTYRR
jgi:hypothetical protein